MVPINNEAPMQGTGASPQKPTKDSAVIEPRENIGAQSLDRALDYHRRGLAVLDLPYGYKSPGRSSWQHERHTTEDTVVEAFGNGTRNIGVLLGTASGNLVDCDQDDAGWALLAERLLPETSARFGRPGKPGGHRLYRCDPLPKSEKFADPIPLAEGGLGTVGEIRAQANQLTVFPDSLHQPSGETICWVQEGEPATVDAEELREAYARGCALLLLRHHWPGEGARHEPGLALAGSLLRGGWTTDEVEEWLRVLWPSAESGQIEGVIRTTDDKLASGDGKVTGWNRLADYVNPAVVNTVRRWLRLGSSAGSFPLTDMGNSERFLEQHGKNVRYCSLWGSWLYWDGQRWQQDHKGIVREWAKLTIRSIVNETHDEPDGERRKEILKWQISSENGRRLDTMLDFARSAEGVAVTPDDLDQQPWLFNVANGTLDLRTMGLREARREDLLTKVAPVAYLPEARAPNWMRFIKTACSLLTATGVVERPELEGYMKRLVGYMLTGDTSEKMLPIAHGPGDTGKTTFTEILLDMFGDDYSKTTLESTIAVKRNGSDAIPNDVAALRGARLVVVSETSEGMRLNEGRIKAMTGRNRVTARFLHQEFFSFVPEFKLLIETNHRPQITGTDTAIWNRVKPLPFVNVVPKEQRDERLPDKLRAELPGILNWALEGCAEWQRDGLGEPEAVREANSEYRDQSDRLKEFIDERCDNGNPDARTKGTEVYRAYQSFCNQRGYHPLNNQRFAEAMKERGFAVSTIKGYNHWQGVTVVKEGFFETL